MAPSDDKPPDVPDVAGSSSSSTMETASVLHSIYRASTHHSRNDGVDIETTESKDPAFDVHWENGDADPENPRSMGLWRKWFITGIVSMGSTCVTAVSSIYTSTYSQIMPEFHSSRLLVTGGLSLFVLGLAFGPMLLSPLSEFYGRRPVYLASLLIFLLLLIPCAVAHNIETILVARFFDGFAGSAFLTVAGGTVGDLFNKGQLQRPMMIYSLAPFVGPSMGPFIGGFINAHIQWRWTWYIMLIWAGVLTASIVLFVPETYHPVLLYRKAARLRQETGNPLYTAPSERLQRSLLSSLITSLYRPFQLLVFELMVLNLCLYSAILLGILYLFFGAFPQVFSAVYGFSLWQNGLPFLSILIGMVLTGGLDPFWERQRRGFVERAGVGKSEPEWRLPPVILGALLVPIGLFWFAWTIYQSINPIVPMIGAAFFGAGMLLAFTGIFTFLVDAYPLYAASALAANAFVRCSFAAIFPLFGHQIYEELNYHWATSLLAFLAVAMMPFPWLFFKYGRRLRAKSRYAVSEE